MGMMRVLASVFYLALPASGFADPSYHRVTGVGPWDVLNIRAEPRADSADIGDLAPDARAIEVLGVSPSGAWARIALAETDGWVATRYLDPDPVATLGDTGLPVGLACSGTEPFWALRLMDQSARYSHPEDGDSDYTLTRAQVAEGRQGSPALILMNGQGGATLAATVQGAACSDGMSDRSYGWAITLRLTAPGQDRFLSGCCHLPRG